MAKNIASNSVSVSRVNCHTTTIPSNGNTTHVPVSLVGSRQRLQSATRGDLVVSPIVTHFGTRSFAELLYH